MDLLRDLEGRFDGSPRDSGCTCDVPASRMLWGRHTVKGMSSRTHRGHTWVWALSQFPGHSG